MSDTIVVIQESISDNILVNIDPGTDAVDVIIQSSTTPDSTVVISNDQGPQGAPGSPGLVPVFTRQNELSPVVGKTRFYFETTRVIEKIRASVGIASTGSGVVVDTLINGVSIGTTTIAAGSNTQVTTVNRTVNQGDYATVSILSVGSTIPGSDLTLTLLIN